jgi:hypothetical protein
MWLSGHAGRPARSHGAARPRKPFCHEKSLTRSVSSAGGPESHGYELKTASWNGPGQLTITLQDDYDSHRNGETFVIRVDPDSGRPQTRTDRDLHCR